MYRINEDITTEVRKENCFDFLRYFFAFMLILAHFCTLTGSDQYWFIVGGMRVKAFFTITGFLVTYSFIRRNCDIIQYAKKRFVRIVPAYAINIVFCLILGLCITTLAKSDFIQSLQTWKYFISNIFMLNWIEPELPGTFQNQFVPQMNGSLWSMKQEVVFYVLVPFFIWMAGKLKRWCMLPVIFLIIVTYNQMPVQLQYFSYFIVSMGMLLYFDWICKHNILLFVISVIISIFTYAVDINYLSDICHSLEPVTFPLILLTVAYHCKPLNVFRKFENITYGLYLYHFPIIQALIFFGVLRYSSSLCLCLTLVLTILFASISWFVIEKPLINKYKLQNNKI